MLPKRKQIHLPAFDYSNTNRVFFLTICVHDKQRFFADPEAARHIADEIDYRANTEKQVTVYAFCIMPDHVHLLSRQNTRLQPGDE